MAPSDLQSEVRALHSIVALGGVSAPLLEALESGIRTAAFRARELEPSIVLGSPVVRFAVNASMRHDDVALRTDATLAVLRALAIPSVLASETRIELDDLARQWLADRDAELFVGWAGERAPRCKIYFRSPSQVAMVALVAAFGAPVPARLVHTVAIDVVDGRIATTKFYRWLDADEIDACASRCRIIDVVRALSSAPLRVHWAEKIAADATGSEAIHVQVPPSAQHLAGNVLAQQAGVDVSRTRAAHDRGMVTRVLGEDLNSGALTVYLALA